MHIRRDFGRSKCRVLAKTELSSNRGFTITIIGAIYEKRVISLTLLCPKTTQKKSTFVKKRKRGNGKGQEATEVNAKGGTHSEHFLKLQTGVTDMLDKHGMKDDYLVMDNVVIHKVSNVQKLILSRVYKFT